MDQIEAVGADLISGGRVRRQHSATTPGITFYLAPVAVKDTDIRVPSLHIQYRVHIRHPSLNFLHSAQRRFSSIQLAATSTVAVSYGKGIWGNSD